MTTRILHPDWERKGTGHGECRGLYPGFYRRSAREGFSLDAQKERLAAYCEAQGWDISDYYIDDGHSGRNTKRPEYQRMMSEKDRWDLILVMKMDRIHRNSKNFMTMMEDLEKWGKKFTSMNSPWTPLMLSAVSWWT